MKYQPRNVAIENLENRRLLSGAGEDTVNSEVLAATDALAATIGPTTPHIGISDHMKHQLHLDHVDHVKHTFFVARQQRTAARDAAESAREAFALSTVPTAELKADGANPEAETQSAE